MTVSAPSAHAQPPRGRRSSRPSGDDREAAILQTAERLLAQRLLPEISVDDLAKGAGISRPTFYFYYPSKDAVFLTLLDRVVQEVDAEIGELQARLQADPVGGWRVAINGFFEAFGTRRWVARAGAAAMRTQPEVRQIWLALMQRWIDQTATLIIAERKRGAAPETIPAKDLAISLNLMNERAMLAAFSGEQPALAHDQVVDALTHIWLTSIYGTAP
jgi:TetR/AcrR family transcriptional regulator, ethionamide resistance regulator